MRERISVMLATETKTASGGATDTITTVCDRWSARVEPLAGRERYDTDQTLAQTTYRVTMRRRDITQKHYVIWHHVGGDRTLDITSALNLDEKRRFLTFDCIERSV